MPSSRVTITDVAREAGVALGTVSNALNHPERVRPETLALITDAIDKLGYAPNQSARMLAGGASRVIGLLLPNLEHGASLQIFNGANSEARKHGYGLLVASTDNDDETTRRYLRYFCGTQAAGVLIQPVIAYGEPLPAPARTMPTVYLDYQSDEDGYFVSSDNRAQGALLARHAIATGATRVAVLGKDEHLKFGRRIGGVREVAEANPGITFEFIDDGAWNRARDGYRLGKELARRAEAERPDFVIALSDVLGTGAIMGIQSQGLSVPGDIKVAGCDGNPLAWTGTVPLTTIAPTGYEIGRRAVQHLIRQVEQLEEAKRRSSRRTRSGRTEAMAKVDGATETPKPTGDETDTPGIGNHQDLIRPFLVARTSTGEGNESNFTDPYLDISGYL